MSRPLFVYGTLSDPDLLAAVLGRATDARQCLAAVAPGFVAVHYPRRIYPALVRAPGGRAEGLLLLGLTAFELDLLDRFEGEEYRREIVPVIIETELHEADAYLPTAAIAPDERPWTLADWQRRHKRTALPAEAALAASIRAALIASRPN